MTPAELREIRETIEREIRTFSILGLPDDAPPLPRPVDGAAEAEIGSALVGGCITIGDLPGLHAKHIEHPYHRVIIEVAPTAPADPDGCLSLEYLENELRNRGHRGDLRAWLLIVRDEVPFRGRESCLIAATRVRELWRRRRIRTRMHEIDAKLCTDATTADDALAEFRKMSERTLGPGKTKAA